MSVEEPVVMSFSQLPQMIKLVEERVAEVPKDQIAALSAIQLLLEIVNSYASWVGGLKEEIKKLEALNISQAEMIRNRSKIQ